MIDDTPNDTPAATTPTSSEDFPLGADRMPTEVDGEPGLAGHWRHRWIAALDRVSMLELAITNPLLDDVVPAPRTDAVGSRDVEQVLSELGITPEDGRIIVK